jgi:hypothetical protein
MRIGRCDERTSATTKNASQIAAMAGRTILEDGYCVSSSPEVECSSLGLVVVPVIM